MINEKKNIGIKIFVNKNCYEELLSRFHIANLSTLIPTGLTFLSSLPIFCKEYKTSKISMIVNDLIKLYLFKPFEWEDFFVFDKKCFDLKFTTVQFHYSAKNTIGYAFSKLEYIINNELEGFYENAKLTPKEIEEFRDYLKKYNAKLEFIINFELLRLAVVFKS